MQFEIRVESLALIERTIKQNFLLADMAHGPTALPQTKKQNRSRAVKIFAFLFSFTNTTSFNVNH
jgi:hypothetical protein